MYKPKEIEKKWQDRWEETKIFEANPDYAKEKKFMTIPYPYASGPMHIGHGRSYVNGDIFARYYRAKGYNVLLPLAFHITGTPVLAISSALERGEKIIFERMREYVALHTSDQEQIEKIVESFVDPWNVVRYFSETYYRDQKTLGMSIDWRRKFTTGDAIYNKFIEWQYGIFAEKNLLEKGAYPILYCPRDQQAVGEDDIASGDELNLDINEFICIKYPFEDGYLVPATLRAETIFGVTNLWINPNGNYVKAKVNGEKWVISEEAVFLFKNQNKDIKVIEKFKGERLIGKTTKDVYGTRDLLILPGEFVDTSTATGVVYSVPSHAPYDYVALEDLKNDIDTMKVFQLKPEEIQAIEPIKIIDLKEFDDHPAKIYCEKFNVQNQNETDKLDEATAENYKIEFYNGILNELCGKYAGKPVSEAINLVINDLLDEERADKIYIPVTRDLKCRCGEKVIVSILPDQWFLNFNAGDWKEKAFKCLDNMTIYPQKYLKNFNYVFNWLDKRPCARKRGLGTKLPFDQDWIIESLSDSTIYMSFYTIAQYLNILSELFIPEQLTPEFFDYVYLEKGESSDVAEKINCEAQVLEQLQNEFLYWYPVDHRHTAIMHISNHLSFFIFHHAAIFPEKLWPKAITLIEPLIIEGEKMGKSKGNLISMAEIHNRYSADLFRFFIAHGADFGISMDFREKAIQTVKGHIQRFYSFMEELIPKIKDVESDINAIESKYSKVMLSKIVRIFRDVDNALTEYNQRKYLQLAFYELFNLIQEFRRDSKENSDFLITFKMIYQDWLKILSLTIPHLCEELWEKAGNKEFISKTEWSHFNEQNINLSFEQEYDYITNVIEDITNINKVIKNRNYNKIYLYTAPEWKNFATAKIISSHGDFEAILKDLKKDPDIMKNKGLIPFIKSQIKNRIWERNYPEETEKTLLEEYKSLIEKRVGKTIEVDSKFDPKKRAMKALPFKPAIFIDV